MHAIIVGCGRVGAEVADGLGQRGYTVAVIDKQAVAFEHLHPGFQGKTFVGPGFDRSILEEAGIKEAEIFIAVTNGDNSNIVCARIAREHYRVPKVAARIYDPRRARIYERLGIPTVATVAWTTDQVLGRVLPASESIEWTVGSGDVVLVGTQASSGKVGKPAGELAVPGKIQVAAVSRFGSTFIPDEKTVIQEGDLLHLAVMRSALAEVDAFLGSSNGAQ